MASDAAANGGGSYRGLLIDYGGVLTTDLFDSFRAFCARYDDTELRALLAGVETAVVARDPSPGPVPHTVENG